MMLLSNVPFCDDPGVIQVFYIIKGVINVIKVAVPIGLIVMVMIDFIRGTMADEKASKEVINKAVKRIVAAVVIFFIPFIIDLIIDLLAASIKDDSRYNEYKIYVTDCWIWSTQETVNAYNECIKDTDVNRKYCWCVAKRDVSGYAAGIIDEICRQEFLEDETEEPIESGNEETNLDEENP